MQIKNVGFSPFLGNLYTFKDKLLLSYFIFITYYALSMTVNSHAIVTILKKLPTAISMTNTSDGITERGMDDSHIYYSLNSAVSMCT